jgi:hypothetical protein
MPMECSHVVSVRITRPNEFPAFAPLKHVVRVWIRHAHLPWKRSKKENYEKDNYLLGDQMLNP